MCLRVDPKSKPACYFCLHEILANFHIYIRTKLTFYFTKLRHNNKLYLRNNNISTGWAKKVSMHVIFLNMKF